MTNLVIPGLGTFADVAAYMAGVGAAARAAARRIARADTQTKNAALRAMAAAIRRDAAKLVAANARDVAAATAAGHDAAFVDRLDADADDHRSDGGGTRADRRAARSRRRDHRPQVSALRHPGRPHARAARRRRHRLRIAPERHRRRRGAVPQGRQRDDPARRQRGAPRATRPSPRASTKASRAAGLPESAVQVIATTDREAVRLPHRRREARRRDRSARRQGPDRAQSRGKRKCR